MRTHNAVDSKAFTDALEAAGYEWRPYSGRSMYGQYCVAVPLDRDSHLFRLALDLKAVGYADNLKNPKTDSLGLGIIAYWPDMVAPDADEEQWATEASRDGP